MPELNAQNNFDVAQMLESALFPFEFSLTSIGTMVYACVDFQLV
jgi:hypothetical protein